MRQKSGVRPGQLGAFNQREMEVRAALRVLEEEDDLGVAEPGQDATFSTVVGPDDKPLVLPLFTGYLSHS